jgi:putative DNA-invertase from lambdoid prophage Rac
MATLKEKTERDEMRPVPRRSFFYINNPLVRQVPEQELIDLDRAGYTVVLSRISLDSVSPHVPAANRPELCALLRRIAADDVLVVLELASLGRSARDVLSTLMLCRKAGIAVRCVELGNVELTSRPEPQAVKTLRAVIRIEAASRSQRSAMGLKSAREEGRSTGRPSSLSRTDRERIVRSLSKGISVSEVARRFGTSRQTVMRVRAAMEHAVEEV